MAAPQPSLDALLPRASSARQSAQSTHLAARRRTCLQKSIRSSEFSLSCSAVLLSPWPCRLLEFFKKRETSLKEFAATFTFLSQFGGPLLNFTCPQPVSNKFDLQLLPPTQSFLQGEFACLFTVHSNGSRILRASASRRSLRSSFPLAAPWPRPPTKSRKKKKARITGRKARFSTSLSSWAKIVPSTTFSQPTNRSMAKESTIFFPRPSLRRMARRGRTTRSLFNTKPMFRTIRSSNSHLPTRLRTPRCLQR